MKRVAIVHDYLNQFGGAERVVSTLHEIFPDAPVYTSIYNSKMMPPIFKKMDIRTSFMQKLPFVMNKFRHYFWLYPRAFESFDLSEYDLIISSSSAYAKGIIKGEGATHICYCYNPMRFVWRYEDYINKETLNPIIKKLLPLLLGGLKRWDLNNSSKVDCFIAISEVVQRRIKSIYKRESVIIFPPVEVDNISPTGKDEDYFLIVARLAAYKRIDVAVEAFSRLGLPLKIVGDGPSRATLEKKAAMNIEFLGKVDESALIKLYSGCRALVFVGEEDFGIVPLEAAASGRPTIAYRAGGAVETIVENKTGVFFEEQSTGSLIEAVKRFEKIKFDRELIRIHSQKFSKNIFKEKIIGLLKELDL